MPLHHYTCHHCSSPFVSPSPNRRFCSVSCTAAARKRFDDRAEKRCPRCGMTKSLDEFYKNPKDNKPRVYCKECVKIVSTNWQKRNKERVNSYHLPRSYGITKKQYDAMLQSQNGVCAICGEPVGARKLCVDHDHETGKVRGLICNGCNSGLAHFRDNTEFMGAAIEYIKASRSS